MTPECPSVVFTVHALQRIFARSISHADVHDALRDGDVIESYPDDTPYPSYLVLLRASARPIHVVVARDEGNARCYVVTVYVPDPRVWSDDFTRRIGR